MLILRPVEGRDLGDLLRLAELLDSMNLPRDEAFLTERIAASERSFAALLPGADGPAATVAPRPRLPRQATPSARTVGNKAAVSRGVSGRQGSAAAPRAEEGKQA